MGPSFPCSGVSGCYCRPRCCFLAGPSAAGPALEAWSRNSSDSCQITARREQPLGKSRPDTGNIWPLVSACTFILSWTSPGPTSRCGRENFSPLWALTFEHADLSWLVRTAFVLSFLVLGMVLTNAWCRYACPTGGLLETSSPCPFLKSIKPDAATCAAIAGRSAIWKPYRPKRIAPTAAIV